MLYTESDRQLSLLPSIYYICTVLIHVEQAFFEEHITCHLTKEFSKVSLRVL